MPKSPYPWIPDWYWDLYGKDIQRFDQFVGQLTRAATDRGFEARILNRTQPQMGSAGTFTLELYCASNATTRRQFVDDRLALSFAAQPNGANKLLNWAFGPGVSCPVLVPGPGPGPIPGPQPGPQPQPGPGPSGDRTVQEGRYIPRNPARVCYLGVRLLFFGA